MEMGCIGFLLGALTSIVFVGIGIGIGRSDKEQPDRDSDIRIYHPSHDRDNRSVDRHRKYAPAEMIFVLNNVKHLTYGWERDILESTIDMIREGKEDYDNE